MHMTTEQMKDIIQLRRDSAQEASKKVFHVYSRTIDMMNAIENGADIDQCFDHWVSLFNDLKFALDTDNRFFIEHISGLASLVDGWYKAKEESNGSNV